MGYFFEYLHNVAVMAGLAMLMLARAIATAPFQLLRWIGKHRLAVLALVDILLLAGLAWVLWATDWSFWGHW